MPSTISSECSHQLQSWLCLIQIEKQPFLADASSHGIGAVLLQRQANREWKPVAYKSRALGTDLYEWGGKTYLLIVDYYSHFIEIAKLSGTTAAEIINHTRSIFARHGIPEVGISDNGPQFSSTAYAQFSNEYGFSHVMSSPLYPQGGEAERAVKTIKQLLRKRGDTYLALLAYRVTPLQCGYSLSELLMS